MCVFHVLGVVFFQALERVGFFHAFRKGVLAFFFFF